VSAASSTWLVADREIRMRLRSKAFLISTGILLLAVIASIVIGSIQGGNESAPKVAAVGDAVAAAEAAGLDVTEADSVGAAEALVRDESVEAAIVPGDGPTGLTVVGLDSEPSGIVALLSQTPTVEVLDPADQNSGVIYIVAFAFGLLYFVTAITFGGIIAQSVVEEKQTRVVEILMATVSTRVLLAGKVIGNSVLAIGQVVLLVAIASIGLLATGQNLLFADIGPSLAWFAVLFAFGFVMLAALFAATASLVSRLEDVNSVTTPVTTLVMIPYFLVILFFDNETVLAIMSYIPFSAPVGMPMRVFLGTAQWWEPVLSLAILLATTVGVILLGSRIYSNSVLRTGSRVKLTEALARAE
jgi:ABC-2 type transport system permease protein